jgi:hypothetical protein
VGGGEAVREPPHLRGVDPDCLACAKARDFPDIFRPPQPRYAATIVRYSMRPNGGWNDISAPYAIGSLIWSFSGKVFDKLRSIMTMGPAYEDIRQVDLLLECEDGNYQKPYSQGDFTPIAPAVWLANDQIRQYTIQYLEQNCASPDDLNDAIGKQVKQDWLADDLLRISQAWDVVRAYETRQQGGAPNLGQGFGAETFQQGMANVAQQWAPPQSAQQGRTPGGNGQPTNGMAGGGTNGFQPQVNGNPDLARQPGGYVAPEQLWEPQWQQPNPSPSVPSVPAGLDFSKLLQAAQPAYTQSGTESAVPQVPDLPSAPQWQPPTPQVQPNQPTPSQEPGPPQQPPASPSAVPQSPQPIQRPDPPAPPQPSPDGLSGLNEFMKSQTSNPAPAPPPPSPAQQPAAPSGGHYTFEDLIKLGKQSQ